MRFDHQADNLVLMISRQMLRDQCQDPFVLLTAVLCDLASEHPLSAVVAFEFASFITRLSGLHGRLTERRSSASSSDRRSPQCPQSIHNTLAEASSHN